MDIRALFFDLYGTLADWLPSAESIQQRCALAEGLHISQSRIHLAYPKANRFLDFENANAPIALRSVVDRRAFFVLYEAKLLRDAGYSVTDEMAERIWDRVTNYPKEFALFDDALVSVRSLKEMGLKLGVISNVGFDLEQMLIRLGIDQHIDISVSSTEAGVAKPDHRIFELALFKVGLQAAQAVHVGDSLESDIVGAQSVGIHPILLDRDGSIEYQPGLKHIRTLRELPDIVLAMK